jgi:hypothetical protein
MARGEKETAVRLGRVRITTSEKQIARLRAIIIAVPGNFAHLTHPTLIGFTPSIP